MSDATTAAPAEAIAVLQRFLEASLRHDVETMRACLSRATLESGNFNDAGQEGVRYELGAATAEGAAWVIPVKAFPADQPSAPDLVPGMVLPARLIREEGAWKFDLATTMDRLMGGAMQAAVQQMGDAMGQAMEGIGSALSEAFGKSGEDSTKSEAEPEDDDEESDEEEDPDEDLEEEDGDEAEDEDPDEEAEQEEDAEGEVVDEATRAKRLNDENFRTAAAGLKENESIWAMQLTYIFGHPAAVELDFDSLGGDYALVQPFIHQGLTAVLEALPTAVMEGILDAELVKCCQKVVIRGTRADRGAAHFTGTDLCITVPLKLRDVRPPKTDVMAALRTLGGIDPPAPPEEPARAMPEGTPAAPTAVGPPARDAGGGDLYAQAAGYMKELEAAMKDNKLWPGPKPEREIEVLGAFGSENMAFTQWLAWVLFPRVNAIVAEHGSFPRQSQVAAYAVREFDGVHEAGAVIDVLIAFDRWIETRA